MTRRVHGGAAGERGDLVHALRTHYLVAAAGGWRCGVDDALRRLGGSVRPPWRRRQNTESKVVQVAGGGADDAVVDEAVGTRGQKRRL